MNIYFCVNGALSQDSSGHEQTFSDKDVFSPPGSSVGPARCPHAVHHAENLNVPPRKFFFLCEGFCAGFTSVDKLY